MSKLQNIQFQKHVNSCQNKLDSMPPTPPKLPMSLLASLAPPPPPPSVTTRRNPHGGIDGELLLFKLKKTKASSERTFEEELDQLNTDLETAGFSYRCPDVSSLRDAKKAAGLGNTKAPAIDYKTFKKQLFRALKLGAFSGVDTDPVSQSAFADEMKRKLKTIHPDIINRPLRDGSGDFGGYKVTFDDCIAWAERVTERPIYECTEHMLATNIVNRLGGGALGGLFPGEALQHSVGMLKELSDAELSARILKDREFIMGEFGRMIAQELQSYYPDQSAELTGSLLASSIELERPPEDVDVNISTQGTDTERTEAFINCVEAVDGETYTVMIPDIGQSITIFPKIPRKLDNRVAEMFYAYSLDYLDDNAKLNFATSASLKGTLVPVDLEIKDVGGSEWTGHLAEGAEERTTNPDGTTKSCWLLADILNRILSFKALMKEKLGNPDEENDLISVLEGKAKLDKWQALVFGEAESSIDGKKLFQKLVAFGNMSLLEFSSEPELSVIGWLEDNMNEPVQFVELFIIGCERNKTKFMTWFFTV